MASTDKLLDELMEKCKKHEDPNGESGFLRQLFRTTLYHVKQNGMAEKQTAMAEKRESSQKE